MNEIKLNETPVRTARNFNINNIKIENVDIPEVLEKFENVELIYNSSELDINSNIEKLNLKYGLGDFFKNQISEKSNYKLKVNFNNKKNEDFQINFKFNQKNQNLVEHIEFTANENTKTNVIIKYECESGENFYHNGVIKTLAKSNSTINVIIINFMNEVSNNFLSIENNIESNSNVNYYIIDFGAKNSITNYYSNLFGLKSINKLNTIYLGKNEQLFDLNYIAELYGKESNIDIEVQGALTDSAKKHFKGTIDFKKGCKKAIGNENENCMLLSEKAKSLALPMLLCQEEEVEGNHSSSAGKIGEKELFYIMSRGFERKEALKLMVRAKFNKIIQEIKNDNIKERILQEIDRRLD